MTILRNRACARVASPSNKLSSAIPIMVNTANTTQGTATRNEIDPTPIVMYVAMY
jgi:hypothetical protein